MNKYLLLGKKALEVILIALGCVVIYNVASFFAEGSFLSKSVAGILSLFVKMFMYVFTATIPCLFLPIAVYITLHFMIQNKFMRVAAGIGCIYVIWSLSGGLGIFTWGMFSTPIDHVMRAVKLSFQVYFLTLLVMPQELINLIGTIAAIVGSLVIDIFPDLPTSLDDMAAICTLIAMIFVYINTFATFIKQQVGRRIDLYLKKREELSNNAPNHKPLEHGFRLARKHDSDPKAVPRRRNLSARLDEQTSKGLHVAPRSSVGIKDIKAEKNSAR